MVERCTLATEREEQRRWRLLPSYAGIRDFDEMIANEFREPAELASLQAAGLHRVLRLAAGSVPYYQALFERLGVSPEKYEGFEILQRLPVLSKYDVQSNEAALCARQLPTGEKIYSWFRSSGTTGRATRVLHTQRSNLVFSYLVQRQFRWFRWDPMRRRGEIRNYGLLPPREDGSPQAPGAACRQGFWRYAGRFFETGPQVGLCATNPAERQLAWLQETEPSYLTANASILDRLAWFAKGKAVPDCLAGVHSISEQMTGVMRARVEQNLAAVVDESYGLNEIGIVALRCAAGHYHVQVEHCVVEVLDDTGAPCAPGTVGRLVVTGLNNCAMPLLRYETGDLAAAIEGSCPCGRSLPAFGELVGRYRHLAGLPEDTLDKILALKAAVRDSPVSVGDRFREYQILQRGDGSYELLLCVEGGSLPAGFYDWVHQYWNRKFGAESPALKLREVDRIPPSPSGKPLEFVSDFAPQ